MATLNRQKYLDLVQSQSISAALTALHRDMAIVEYQAFEGNRKHEPEMLDQLNAMRDFSRELWEIDLKRGSS
jgi:hypothetical protein